MKKLLFLVLLLSNFFGFAQYTLIPDVNFEKALIRLGIDSGSIDGNVLTANVSGVTKLQVQFSYISDLTGIQDFTALIDLECHHNQLTSLDVTKNTSLVNLVCDNNQLTSLDVSKNTSLDYFWCNSNKLTSLDLSNSIITFLNCENNNLLTLNLKNGKNTNFNIYSSLYLKSNPNLTCIQVDNKFYSDANWSHLKDTWASYSEDCNKITATIAPPVITATGNQIYCPGTSLNIAQSVTITFDSTDPEIYSVYIQISSGYINGQDQLILKNASSHPSIKAIPFDPNTGILKLISATGSKVSSSDFEAAIKDVQFSNSSPFPSSNRAFSLNIGTDRLLSYLPRNKHFYEYAPSIGITWTAARDAAAALTYYGLTGYLATLTAADEAQLAGAQAPGAGWIGGSDAETEGIWKWVTGPEAGTVMTYTNWNSGEPNNLGDEDYAHITAPGVGIPGSWNDLSNTGSTSGDYQPKGYIVEFGEMSGDPILQISASTTITIPQITILPPNPICDSGSFILQATTTIGTINWYNASSDGILLGTGNTYITPPLNTTTTYYADNGCTIREPIMAAINPIPTISSTSPASVCNSGTVTLGATASGGIINWYDIPTGGTALGTGTTFTTPSISATKTFYVDATASLCTTASRTPIVATVIVPPSITSTTTASRCDSGTVSLGAITSGGTINWYDVPTGGTTLGTGISFTTPTIENTSTYYVDATATGCTSERIPVVATVYPIVKIMEEVILCQNETATLDASIPGMIYLWSPGGETTQTIVISTIGDYSVSISSPTITSCDLKKNISVIEHPAPIINSILVNENSIVIELDNPENYYEFSINGLDFKDSNQFSYIQSGQHTAYVREKNGCNLVNQNFIVFTIAKYFTPNNDGKNDVWEIKEMRDYPNSRVEIFNRYGKLLKQLNSGSLGWNGTYNGIELPADDYWYRLKLDDTIPIIKGHFSLKR